jgi:F-type H+-transporting ATPase subunit gamma
MTHRHDLERQRHSLAEIRDIMNSMRTLAYMETRKLSRFLDAQHAVVDSIESAATDLLGWYPDILPDAGDTTPVYLVIGTERGFCGDFNHALLRSLRPALQAQPPDEPLLIVTGRKLHSLLEGDARVVSALEGASVAEEITSLLGQMVSVLARLQSKHGLLAVHCLYHGSDDGIAMQKLLPPFHHLPHRPPPFSHPPLLNLSPEALLGELTDLYLFAALHGILYASLMMENQQRVTHLEGAVRHLDDQAEDLVRKCNVLRQEEIIEEIEVILLGATDSVGNPRWG